MATSKKGKKVVNQEELRRLMREKQRQTTDKRRVESPFAKYNSLGHLNCVLCSVHVKSEMLWSTHVLGKQHKEKVAELKGGKSQQQQQQPPAPQLQPPKRRAPDSDDVNGKKPKTASIVPAAQSASGPDVFKKPTGTAPKSAGLSLLVGVYDEGEDDDDDEDDAAKAGSSKPPAADGASGLPADFFDSSVPSVPAIISHSGSIQKAETTASVKSVIKGDNTAEALPEGFFDDPVRDAKVRNVEAPKDQMDKEWEEFQKEIRQVNTKSEAIVAEDDEEGRLERQIDEIDEQIACYKRVELLRDKRDVVKNKPPSRRETRVDTELMEEEEEDEEADEELLDLMSGDWRSKGALS